MDNPPNVNPSSPKSTITIGRQICTSLDESSAREWLVTDGRGGFAMGTVGGLATRRYHGLLVVATEPPIGRRLGLAALDAKVVIGDQVVQLATHEWASGAVAPLGFVHLDRFEITDGVPCWQWKIGSVVLQAEVAMTHGAPCVGVLWKLIAAAPAQRVELRLDALCTWRDVHGERFAWHDPDVVELSDGFEFEAAYTVRGPGFVRAGEWYRGVHHREEAARGLNSLEDLWLAGTFHASLSVGDSASVEAWGHGAEAPGAAAQIVDAARERARDVALVAGATDAADALLAHAADQFIVTNASGTPTVVAGYPWFGDWSRDTMTSYEGLFLETGRGAEGRRLLIAAASSINDGMLANTADAGGTEYNTVDATMWFLHAVRRHIERTADHALGEELLPVLVAIVEHHVRGTRFGIHVDSDGLVTQGADGWALTWMDARVDGVPVTPRTGKPVEVNALWVEGLDFINALAHRVSGEPGRFVALAEQARTSLTAFVAPWSPGLFDVIGTSSDGDSSLRPNQLIAASLGLLSPELMSAMVQHVEPLVTPVGLRSLSPGDGRYIGKHRGGSAERDRAYHQGTVWPWLIGPLTDVRIATGRAQTSDLDALLGHLYDFGLGSVSETLDGDAPHSATGCPFQAWSVAELLRARRRIEASIAVTNDESAGTAHS